QVHGEQAQWRARLERDVDAPAQVGIANGERTQIRVARELDAGANRETDFLVADGRASGGIATTKPMPSAGGSLRHDDAVLMRRKHACRRGLVFDFLEGDDVGTGLFGVLAHARVVRLAARPATLAIGFSQMLEVPAGALQRLA